MFLAFFVFAEKSHSHLKTHFCQVLCFCNEKNWQIQAVALFCVSCHLWISLTIANVFGIFRFCWKVTFSFENICFFTSSRFSEKTVEKTQKIGQSSALFNGWKMIACLAKEIQKWNVGVWWGCLLRPNVKFATIELC